MAKAYVIEKKYTQEELRREAIAFVNSHRGSDETAAKLYFANEVEGGLLNTLRRLPDEIVLDIAGRDINLFQPHACVCGWALNSAITFGLNKAVAMAKNGQLDIYYPDEDKSSEEVRYDADVRVMAEIFGGNEGDWQLIFMGVTEGVLVPYIEEALTRRLMEALKI